MNLEKIQKLLLVGADAVRICFDKYFPKEDLEKLLKENETDMRRGHFRFQPPQLEILFPKQGGPNTGVSSLSMDVTIMYKLLRNYSDIDPPLSGWGKEPEVDHITEIDDIERIRLYRNKYSMHYYVVPNRHVISDDVFNVIWTDLSLAIMRLSNGVLKRRINEIRKSEPTGSTHAQVPLEESKSKSAIASPKIHESIGYKGTEDIIKLLHVATDAVRICFDKHFSKEDLEKTLKDNETYMRRGQFRFQTPQLEILFPKQDGSNTGVSSLFMDFPTMYKLLRNFSDIASPGNEWGRKPDVEHRTESDDIERIRIYRNMYIHDSRSKQVMDKGVLNLISTDLSQAIMRLSGGALKDRINEILNDKTGWPSTSCYTEIFPDDTVFFPPPKKIKTEICLKCLQKETMEEEVLNLSSDLKKPVPYDPMFFPSYKFLSTDSDENSLKDYRNPLKLHGMPSPLKKSKHINQIDALESETCRNELKSALSRIEHVDCNDICGRFVKHFSIGKIETCSKCSTQGIFRWTKSCSEKIREARTQKCKCFISTFCVLITIKVRNILAHAKINELHFVVKHLMDFAIESRNYILLSELVRMYAFHPDFQLEKLFMETSEKINAVIVDTILLSAKCMILKRYARLLQNSIHLSLCYDCGRENLVAIMCSYKGTTENIAVAQEKVMGMNIILYNRTNPSEEACTVFQSYATSHSKETLPTISEKEARELFKRHSNLTMISASPHKSVGYSRKKQRIVEKPCILLLCLHKGYIPYGEKRFPQNMGNVEVDVQEGFCNFGNGELLEMGGDIRRKGSKSIGSIGGFVNLSGNKTGLITCAHVVLSLKELKKRDIDPSNDVEVFINSAHSFQVCGKVVYADFPKPVVSGVHLQMESSVDAALIELASPPSVADYRTVTGEQLLSAGFQTDKPPKFHGKILPVHNLTNIVSGSVIKYGATTGLTLGCVFNECMHVRINYEDKLQLSDILGSANSPCDIVVFNQMEIESLRGRFFELGDSGSFVFCINQDETLSCIGMAIGYTSRGTCLVTPIENVLKSLKLPVTSKCIIPVEARLSPGVKTSTEAAILNAITQMQSNFDKLDKRMLEQQKDIQDIKRKLTNSNSSQNQSGININARKN